MNKILVIAPYSYLPYFSGGQKFIAKFLHYLGEKKELTVVTVGRNDFSLAKGYATIPLLKEPFSRYYDLSLISKITNVIKEKNIDTVIWEHPYFAWLAFIIRRKTGVKTFFHTHNIEHQRFKSTGKWWWPVLKWYEKWCFKKADGIFFITPEDKAFATGNWKIDPSKCIDLPFGVDNKEQPADRQECRQQVAAKHHISVEENILLFNGWLNYKPNLDALKAILNKINPILESAPSFRYKLIICGKGIPAEMNELKDYTGNNIIYAGFVEDIELYFKASDVLLNPVQSGGGIKTKMVEAIAFGTTVVSVKTGAAGMDIEAAGDKLVVVNDADWKNFADETMAACENKNRPTLSAFYSKYNWESIINHVIESATSLTSPLTGK